LRRGRDRSGKEIIHGTLETEVSVLNILHNRVLPHFQDSFLQAKSSLWIFNINGSLSW